MACNPATLRHPCPPCVHAESPSVPSLGFRAAEETLSPNRARDTAGNWRGRSSARAVGGALCARGHSEAGIATPLWLLGVRQWGEGHGPLNLLWPCLAWDSRCLGRPLIPVTLAWRSGPAGCNQMSNGEKLTASFTVLPPYCGYIYRKIYHFKEFNSEA